MKNADDPDKDMIGLLFRGIVGMIVSWSNGNLLSWCNVGQTQHIQHGLLFVLFLCGTLVADPYEGYPGPPGPDSDGDGLSDDIETILLGTRTTDKF